MHEGLESGLGLLLGEAGLQAAEGVHPAIAALLEHVFWIADDDLRLHHDRNEDFRGEAEFHAVKTCLGNADNGHLVIVESESLAYDLGIAGKARFPKVVIEDDVRMPAGDLIVFGSEDASHSGNNAESGEVGAGDEFDGNAFRLLAEGKARGSGKAAEHIGEDFVVITKITEHGMGDGVATPVAAVVAAAHGEQDELLGIFHGEKAQQDLVEEREDGGVCANAESECEDSYGSKTGSADKHAEGVLEVAKDGVEPAGEGQAADRGTGGRGH